jgi:hypothetical protein
MVATWTRRLAVKASFASCTIAAANLTKIPLKPDAIREKRIKTANSLDNLYIMESFCTLGLYLFNRRGR